MEMMQDGISPCASPSTSIPPCTITGRWSPPRPSAASASTCPYPHAVETVNRWYDAGHSIHIASRRAERSLTATRRWLDDIGLRHHELSCDDDKIALSRRIGIDLLIDDSPDTLLRALDAGILTATLSHPWNAHVCDASPVTCAADWRELARVLEPVLDREPPG